MTAVALTIAGSDPSGGAGIQADLKTFAANGVYGASVITALTAQNTMGVRAIHDVPASFVAAQVDAIFADFDVAAVKLGMMPNAAVIETVAERLEACRARNVVLDPVLAASSGDPLSRPGATDVLRRLLVPRATLITPNLAEAALLLEQSAARTESEMISQAEQLLALGAKAVLMKGGHLKGPESADLLVRPGERARFVAKRIDTSNDHGTGCTLSSAVAAGLAKGDDLTAAVKHAKDFVTGALAAADTLSVGHGRGPLHHFYQLSFRGL
jgi:hydroxymethylpyrimidine/phosphomethylpyrimidine kinase